MKSPVSSTASVTVATIKIGSPVCVTATTMASRTRMIAATQPAYTIARTDTQAILTAIDAKNIPLFKMEDYYSTACPTGSRGISFATVVSGFVLIVLAGSALASVLAWQSRLGNESASVAASDRPPVKADIEAAIDPEPEEGVARVRVKCAECGVVESTREIVQILETMDSGTAGRVKRDRLKDTAGNSISNYEVTVRMKNGATHQFMVANPVNWRPGERVIFIAGRNRLSE